MSEVDYSKPLNNPKHETFVQGLLNGKTADQAYVDAGYKENRHNAARLKNSEHIRKRLAFIQGKAAAKTQKTLEDILQWLEDAQKGAQEAEQYSASVKAATEYARLTGLGAATKVQLTGADGGPIQTADVSASELAKAILELTPEQRAIARVLAEKKVKR